MPMYFLFHELAGLLIRLQQIISRRCVQRGIQRNGYWHCSYSRRIIHLSVWPLGPFKILIMSNDVCWPIRGLFGRPERLMWPINYYNFKLSDTDMSASTEHLKEKPIGRPTY